MYKTPDHINDADIKWSDFLQSTLGAVKMGMQDLEISAQPSYHRRVQRFNSLFSGEMEPSQDDCSFEYENKDFQILKDPVEQPFMKPHLKIKVRTASF